MTTKTTGWAPAGPAPKRWTRTKAILKGIFWVWVGMTAFKLLWVLLFAMKGAGI